MAGSGPRWLSPVNDGFLSNSILSKAGEVAKFSVILMEDTRDCHSYSRLDTEEVLKEPSPWDGSHGILPDSGGRLVKRQHEVLPPWEAS